MGPGELSALSGGCGDDNCLHLFHNFPRVFPDLGMEKELRNTNPSAIADLRIPHRLAWSFSTVRLISAVQEFTSSSIEPARRNLFHRFFFAQRFIRFSTQ